MSAPVLLVFPGASLMDIEPVAGGVRVRCPGCDAEQVFATPGSGQQRCATFEHEADCPVHARIRAAVEQDQRAVVRRG